ncbi:MAG: nitroreductase family deazaflavin-dependent oxidoreductase [Pseudomonadota bacterium]
MGEHLFGDEHVRRYLETDGEVGYRWRNGAPILILTTTGRKSGEPRLRPLIFGEDDGRYVVVASQGGAPAHPNWYLNLRTNPDVHVQIRGDRFAARARTAEGEERERLWRRMAEIWPPYDDYQRRTDRTIPVVVLERA